MAKRAPKVLRPENWLRSSCGATGKDLLGLAALFVAGCDGAEVFQSVDRALNVIAAFVSGRIETWWRSASTAFSWSVFLGIATLRANTAHATVMDLLSIVTRTIGTVYT